MSTERLRPGEQVALRTPDEILATLDPQGALEGVPFMPEMLKFYGTALRVAKRAEKICDTICPIGSRRLPGCVYLEDARCDGTAHGGCQAECRLYWKEAWLTRCTGNAPPAMPDPSALARLHDFVTARTRQPANRHHFRCQATEARRATTPLREWDLRQYAREVSSGNITLREMLRVALRAVPWELKRLARRPAVALPRNRLAEHRQPERLNLQPGEWVEVRSAEEIARTLDARGYNRGLYFSAPEMLAACGKHYRVHRRVERIIDEVTGKMIRMKNECIVLEGLVCKGDRSVGRWFCGREIYPYWREAWLKRVGKPAYVAPASPIPEAEPVEAEA
jgi:hypothetical protein